jgi:hypothetical protein
LPSRFSFTTSSTFSSNTKFATFSSVRTAPKLWCWSWEKTISKMAHLGTIWSWFRITIDVAKSTNMHNTSSALLRSRILVVVVMLFNWTRTSKEGSLYSYLPIIWFKNIWYLRAKMWCCNTLSYL